MVNRDLIVGSHGDLCDAMKKECLGLCDQFSIMQHEKVMLVLATSHVRCFHTYHCTNTLRLTYTLSILMATSLDSSARLPAASVPLLPFLDELSTYVHLPSSVAVWKQHCLMMMYH